MSAAAPPPPPVGNGGGHGGYSSRPSSSSNSNGTERPFRHIQDLKLQALSGFERNASVYQLLGSAEAALNQAQTYLIFRRADSQELSYIEYMRASEIVVEVIPRNKGWPDFQMDHHGGGMQKYQLLQKRINAQSEQFASIKEIIVNNNKRSGVQPSVGAGGGHMRTESALQINGNISNGAPPAPKVRPTPSPKPDNLHGRAIPTATDGAAGSGSSGAAEALNDRFARLRMKGAVDTNRPESSSSNFSSPHSSSISKGGPSDFGTGTSFESLSKTSSTTTPRLVGPRPMPPPPVPGKLPLDTSIAGALPKEPSPIYSPARNMQTTENIALPRHTARSLAATSTRRTSTAPSSSASSHAPNGINESGDYFPATTASRTNSIHSSQVARRKSVNVPKETRISNERLYDYIKRFNILLIDFRPREEFDQGHIYSRTVMCVDPIQVSQGMSADQLQERMVISPDVEQDMFMNRDQFDLVVYYDGQTQSDNYLTRPFNESETKLKYLHEALFDFNHEKPLRHPPILLIGGIDAWVNLIGPQGLMTSNTAAKVKQGRPIQRRPAMTNGRSQIRNPKRRLRDYNPLNDEEERKWRERARAESVVLQTPPIIDENGQPMESQDEGDEEPSSAIREFLERFPEAGSLERQAFGPLQPSRPAPEPPPKVPIPSYPPPAPPASFPSRPAPAAGRPSYTGVSDRAASQVAPMTRSTSLAPYIPPKYFATNLRLPKTGLVNFRFTCYMNATLQALSATTPLSIFFLDDQWRGFLQRENWKGTRGVLPELYSNLVRSLWKGDVDYIRPTTFRTFCGRLKSEWGRDDQEQDAKEFFDFLVDGLHEDLNVRWAKSPLKELTPAEEAHRERMPKPYVAKLVWGRFTHRDQSFITDLFGGQYSSRLQCLTCGHTSTTYDAFYSLSVEIPRPRGRIPTLNDCLESYCSQETLKGGEQARCDKCKEFRDSTKQITITRAPQSLVVHFKRFHTVGRVSKKINTAIDFPLDNFDLEPYMLKQPSAAEAEHIAQDFGPDAVKTDASMTPPYTYDAYGVIRHLGPTLEEGHYKALVKDRARRVWRCFDDRLATDFVPDQGEYKGSGDLRNGQAYIVFYQRTLPSQMGSAGGPGKI